MIAGCSYRSYPVVRLVLIRAAVPLQVVDQPTATGTVVTKSTALFINTYPYQAA